MESPSDFHPFARGSPFCFLLPGGILKTRDTQHRARRKKGPVYFPRPKGKAGGAAQALARSAAHGRKLVTLLDPETTVRGVTQTPLRTEIAAIAVPTTVVGRNMTGDDFAVTAGWGHFGAGDAVMPGKGHIVERPYAPEESAAMGEALPVLGDATIDVHLNGDAFWRNVPSAVWDYRLGGYQVLKKWLSYREHKVLSRRLSAEEVRHFTHRHRTANWRATAGVVGRTREEAALTEKLIDRNPDVLGGIPVFSGARVPVWILMEHLRPTTGSTTFWTTTHGNEGAGRRPA